jgi:hypothetical protein
VFASDNKVIGNHDSGDGAEKAGVTDQPAKDIASSEEFVGSGKR